MRSHEVITGRTVIAVFDHGEDFYTALDEAGLSAADIVGTCDRLDDPQAPVWSKVHLTNVEALGGGTLAYDPDTDTIQPHIHVTVGSRLGRSRHFGDNAPALAMDDYLSRYDVLLAVRINPLGADALGLTGAYQPPSNTATPERTLKVLPTLDIVAIGEPTTADRLVLDAHAHHSSDRVWTVRADTLLAAVGSGRPYARTHRHRRDRVINRKAVLPARVPATAGRATSDACPVC